jgi:hypothetical protein
MKDLMKPFGMLMSREGVVQAAQITKAGRMLAVI